MMPVTQALKNFAPFILTGGGIGMLGNTLLFEIGYYPSAADDRMPMDSSEKFLAAVDYATRVGIAASIISNVFLLSAKLITHLPHKQMQFYYLDLACRSVPKFVIGANVVCAFLSIVIKSVGIAARILFPDFFTDDATKLVLPMGYEKELSETLQESIVEIGSFALSGALGAAGAFLIQKYVSKA